MPLGIGAFFILVAAVEFLSAQWHESHALDDGGSPTHTTEGKVVVIAPGEFSEYNWRGERTCFGTTTQLGERTIYLDLRRDRLLEERMRAARALISQAPQLAASFAAFKTAEAKKQSEWAEEILGLQIEMITLHAKSDPGFGEVYFTAETGNDAWFCVLADGKFSGLSMET